ncbi:MAG: YidB family protein [Candidatus Nanopelagicales bacterium]
MAGIQDILGSVLGGSGGSGSADIQKLIQPLLDMIQQNGGLQQVLAQLQNSPIGEQVTSWISPGANESVSADQVAQAVGPETVEKLAEESGMTPDQVSGSLTQLLPNLVDKFTPGGSVPGADQIQEVIKNIPGADQVQDQLGSLLGGLLGGGK